MNQTNSLVLGGVALSDVWKRRVFPRIHYLLALFVPLAVGTRSCWAQPGAGSNSFPGAQYFYSTNIYPTNTKANYLEHTDDFRKDRYQLLKQQEKRRFCVDEKLSPKEQEVSKQLQGYVRNQFRIYRTQINFGPALPFYNVKDSISNSPLFQLLRRMPKGGLLHTHLSAAGRMDWIITNALTLSNCYVSWESDTHPARGGLNFFLSPHRKVQDGFKPMSEMAARFQNATGGFGAELRRRLTIGPEDTAAERIWVEFGSLFGKLNGFVRYQTVFTNYLFDAFETLWKDGVYYVELRDSAAPLYRLDGGSELKDGDVIREILRVRDRMKAAHPNFDCRLILADVRAENEGKAATNLARAFKLRQDFEDFIIGYDLIGEEDPNEDSTSAQKVVDLLPALQKVQERYRKGLDLPYYLHDGESAWPDNDNVLDAMLLRAPRIGHGFNLFRYPTIYPLLIASNTVLEICPISNQVLDLITDLRLHPAHGYLSAGIQCVLASDDPAFFGNDGLSYDFWEAVMAWNLDLAAVKKLARNSIAYSGLERDDKKQLMIFWEQEWNKFITGESVANAVTSNLQP